MKPMAPQATAPAGEPAAVEVPAYQLHPADLKTIREVAAWLRMDVVEYAQVAPYLYAQDLLRGRQRLDDVKEALARACADYKNRGEQDCADESG